jgi:hypothetical protein
MAPLARRPGPAMNTAIPVVCDSVAPYRCSEGVHAASRGGSQRSKRPPIFSSSGRPPVGSGVGVRASRLPFAGELVEREFPTAVQPSHAGRRGAGAWAAHQADASGRCCRQRGVRHCDGLVTQPPADHRQQRRGPGGDQTVGGGEGVRGAARSRRHPARAGLGCHHCVPAGQGAHIRWMSRLSALRVAECLPLDRSFHREAGRTQGLTGL